MSEKISNNNKGGVEEYKVLDEVYDANWRDDVPEEDSDVIQFEYLTDNSNDSKDLDEADYDYNASLTSKNVTNGELVRIYDFNEGIDIKTTKANNLMKKAA